MNNRLAFAWHICTVTPIPHYQPLEKAHRRPTGSSESEGMMPAVNLPRQVPSTRLKCLFALGLAIWPGVLRAGDFPAPPPPKEYNVEIRYQIYTDPNQRIAQFQDLVLFLESIGFHKKPAADPRAEIIDPRQTRMIALNNLSISANAGRRLDTFRRLR